MGILDIIGVLNPIIDRVFPDPKDKLELQEKLATLADQESARVHEESMGQITTNTAEAANTNMFVSGWRPFVGWTCGLSLGYAALLEPFMNWTATVLFHYHGNFPILNTDQTYALLYAMLGFGGLRTFEKVKGLPDSTPGGASAPPTAGTVVAPPKKKVLGIPWPF